MIYYRQPRPAIDLINVLEDFIDFYAIESLPLYTSSDEDRERVKEEYQTVFKEVFDQNLGQDIKESDIPDFDNFLRTIVQRVKDLVESVPESEQRNALRNLVNKFREFGIAYYTYHETSDMGVDRSLPPPKN